MTNETKKVLVLEDSEIFSGLLENTLHELGYNPLVTDNIEEARSIIDQQEVYAAILDNEVRGVRYGPPLRDAGLDFGMELRDTHPRLRIALHTSSTFDQDGVEYLTSMGIRYLYKMADQKDLASF